MNNRLLRIIGGTIFCVFSFCYLFFYQGDVMRITQHIVSGGQTSYSPWLGAVLITLVLLFLAMGVRLLFSLKKLSALAYFPSALLLALITDIDSRATTLFLPNTPLWVFIVLLILFIPLIIFISKRESQYLSNYLFLRQLWMNLGVLTLLFLLVCIMSNHDKGFHDRAKIEALINEGDFTAALQAAKRMETADSVSTMLILYSNARLGTLADSLFEYPLTGGSKVLQPGRIHSLMQPDSVINKTTRRSANYHLAGFLLDKDLRNFVKYLSLYYPTDSLLPRYYQEAKDIYLHGANKSQAQKGSYTYYYLHSPQ